MSYDVEFNLEFFYLPKIVFQKYQNCNLSLLKKHTSANEFQIEGEKSYDHPLIIYIKTFTSQNYRVVEPGYSNHSVENPENPCFCAVFTKNCIALSQSNSIIFFWYIISIEKLNTNRTFNVLNNYVFKL